MSALASEVTLFKEFILGTYLFFFQAADSLMEVTFCRGMGVNLLTSTWTWIGNTNINYALVATKQLRAGTDSEPASSSMSDSDST